MITESNPKIQEVYEVADRSINTIVVPGLLEPQLEYIKCLELLFWHLIRAFFNRIDVTRIK